MKKLHAQELSRYFALTSYCDTIDQSNNAFPILGFSLAGKRRVHVLIFSSTYRNQFSRSYENHSNVCYADCDRINPLIFTILPLIKQLLMSGALLLLMCIKRPKIERNVKTFRAVNSKNNNSIIINIMIKAI